MATMIDQKPEYIGEAKVWDAIKMYLPNSMIAYNNREINGREFDYCLLIENVGALIIEVKGWSVDKIKVNGVDNIIVDGYEKPQRSPKKQARAYRFAMLNKITEKYNVSPLVFDMVCYPFISKAEYLTAHLDIVSEEQFTIFREELENSSALREKIQSAYDASKSIPHAELSTELIMNLRHDWEPDFAQRAISDEVITKPYSVLSIYPSTISKNEHEKIAEAYFRGTKQIVFVGNKSDFLNIIAAINEGFKKANIQPRANNLIFGYTQGLTVGISSAHTFNIEIYFVENLFKISTNEIHIEEGQLSKGLDDILTNLSAHTTFNFQQYKVEHAPVENNTLVEAGAGTGKTFSMVSRVAFLCNKKVGAVANIADEIAMVTFTNDAAINMKVRLKQMFVNYFILTRDSKHLKYIEDIDRSHISTIHSFAFDILRNEVLYTGLGTNFRISSNEHLRSQIYDVYLSEFLTLQENANPNFINEIPVPVYDLKKKIISVADRLLAKSVDLGQIKPSEMGVPVDNTLPYFNELIERVIIPAEEKYSEDLHLFNDMDLKECVILLEKVLKQLKDKLDSLRIRYLFVDEFQDTDDVQIHVFQQLQKAVNADCRLFVVGDLKQSIYRFRGARLSAFTQLMNASLFDWDTYQLTINYRTDQRLLEQYDRIFCKMGAQNYLPYKKERDSLISNIVTDENSDRLFVAVPCHARDEEKFFETFVNIVKEQRLSLEEMIKQRTAANLPALSKEERTIAVLVRSNWQVDRLVSAAKGKDVKIDTKSGGDLYRLESTLDLYKLLLVLNNASNPLYIVNFIESNYTNLKLDFQSYHGMDTNTCVDDLKRILDEFFSTRMGKTWQQVINDAYTQPVLFVLKQIYDALQPWQQYSHRPLEQRYYMANYEYLIERIIKFSRVDTITLNQLTQYLKVCILTGQEQLSREIEIDDDDIQIICTTIHKSKGLEYGTVILPYTYEDVSDIRKVKLDANYSGSKLSYTVLFENKIRERNSNYNENIEIGEQISEESRILYVALTRAIRNCVWIRNVDSSSAISWGTLMEE